MKPLVVSLPIAAPPERVFALATDLASAPTVYTGIESVEPLTEGPFGVGTKWRETRRMMRQRATEQLEITAFDPAGAYTAESNSCGCRYMATLTCSPHVGGTLAKLEITSQPTSLVARLMSPLAAIAAGPMKQALSQDLADLKAAAEKTPSSDA